MPILIIFALTIYPVLLPLSLVSAQDDVVSEALSPASTVSEKEMSDPESADSKESENEISSEQATVSAEKELIEKTTNEIDQTEPEKIPATNPDSEAGNNTDNSLEATTGQATPNEAPSEDANNEEDPTCECQKNTEQDTTENIETSTERIAEQNICCDEKNEIENNNDAVLATGSTDIANTGENVIETAQNSDSTKPQDDEAVASESLHLETTTPIVAIETGLAFAENTVINNLNTNIISENYIDSVINITDNAQYDINLLDQFQELLETTQTIESAGSETLSVENINIADITNDAQSIANSGENILLANEDIGGLQIVTGDASANSNIVNIVNRNIIGDTWIFSVINVVGDWVGDLIVPGEGLLQTSASQVATSMEISNENNADINNNVSADANSGENSITNVDDAAIFTGKALSEANVINIANTNITKNNWFVLLINNLGSWSGKIIGRDDTDNESSNLYEYNFETTNESDFFTSIYSFLSIHNNNQAVITNNATALASTGNNSISSQAGDASIQTGDASANANVVNITNTNIVGNNWIFAIVNVLGSWTGNVVAAYPDISIAISDGIRQAETGSLLTYQVSYENIGQANCDNTFLEINLPPELKYQNSNAAQSPAVKNSSYIWPIGKMNVGEKKSFTLTVLAENENSAAVVDNVSASISTETKEINLLNNSASDETTLLPKSILQNILVDDSPDSNLKISRPKKEYPATPTNSLIEQSINIENTGDDILSDVIITEIIKNPNNEIVGKYSWPIATINPHEKGAISYQIMMSPDATAGTYNYHAAGVAINSVGEKISSNKSLADMIIFAMSFNNTAQAATLSEEQPSIENNAQDSDNANILGMISSNSNPLWPWLPIPLLIAYVLTWFLLKKIKQKLMQKKISTNNASWGSVHEIQAATLAPPAPQMTMPGRVKFVDSIIRQTIKTN